MLRQIGQSALAIVLVQGINFLVPLLALPHISRALGLHGFGLYSVLVSYGNYVLMFSDFSFNVNGPLLVAEAQTSGSLRGLTLDSTLLKVALLVPALIVFGLSAWKITEQSALLLLFAALVPVTTTLTPRWIMYSVGDIYWFAAGSLISKGAWLALVYSCVNSPADTGVLFLITALTQVILLVFCSYVVIARGAGTFRPSLGNALTLFRRDLRQFVALLGTSCLRDLSVIVLAAVAGTAQVSIYSLADRVRFAIMGVVTPVSQSLFLISARFTASGQVVPQKVRGLVNLAILAGAFGAGATIFIFADVIVGILGGQKFIGSRPLLQMVAFAPTFTALNSILGVNTLLAKGFSREYASCQMVTLVISAPVMITLILVFSGTGAALAVLTTEVIATVVLTRICWRCNLLPVVFSLSNHQEYKLPATLWR